MGLGSCARFDVAFAAHEAEAIATRSNLVASIAQTEAFDLWTFQRLSRPGSDLRVYIEGDGLAFLSPYQPSPDPTPSTPLALKLAALDSSPNVIYLARPCQYQSRVGQRGCSYFYWTTHRYAPEVVAALDRTISAARAKGMTGPITLIGYSGGGTLATLIAARRSDVDRVITVAANLDHAAWTSLDDSTPLFGSLNPPDFADMLSRIPQLHMVGDRDRNVPLSVTESYRRALSVRADVQIVRFPQNDHVCCWVENWPAILARWFDRS